MGNGELPGGEFRAFVSTQLSLVPSLLCNAFWATMYGSYPRVAVAALTLMVAFPSMYLCESAFSSMVQIKTKSRNRLIDLESDLRCAISKVEPNIEALVQAKQMQKSH